MIDFSILSEYTPDQLFEFGFKVYQDFGKYTLLLIPSSLYEVIPDGIELIDTECLVITFQKGVTPSTARFGLLGYGVLIPKL